MPAASLSTAQERPYVERVEVNVRRILVRITNRAGATADPPPRASDVRVLEDAVPAEVVGVDAARPSMSAFPPSATPTSGRGEAPVALTLGEIPQHLYVDTSMLELHSIRRLVKVFERGIDSLLQNGPLEIVVADP
jgi:hypothetical protein